MEQQYTDEDQAILEAKRQEETQAIGWGACCGVILMFSMIDTLIIPIPRGAGYFILLLSCAGAIGAMAWYDKRQKKQGGVQ